MKTLAQVLKNKTPYSSAEYKIEKGRSDGRLPDRTKPATKDDKIIHFSHIEDSAQYNIRHTHDHTSEFVFDIGRLKKEKKDQKANKLIGNYQNVMNKQLSKVGLKIIGA